MGKNVLQVTNMLREQRKDKDLYTMYASKVYVYGLLDEFGDIDYVGKSSRVRGRVREHNQDAVILDCFYDLESYWISVIKQEGYSLRNSEHISDDEELVVGTIITNEFVYKNKDGNPDKRSKAYKYYEKKNNYAILDTNTGNTYPNMLKAAEGCGVDYGTIRSSARGLTSNKRFVFYLEGADRVLASFMGRFQTIS